MTTARATEWKIKYRDTNRSLWFCSVPYHSQSKWHNSPIKISNNLPYEPTCPPSHSRCWWLLINSGFSCVSFRFVCPCRVLVEIWRRAWGCKDKYVNTFLLSEQKRTRSLSCAIYDTWFLTIDERRSGWLFLSLTCITQPVSHTQARLFKCNYRCQRQQLLRCRTMALPKVKLHSTFVSGAAEASSLVVI